MTGAGARADRRCRIYPLGRVFARSVGYSFIQAGSAGVEEYYNDEFSGQTEEFESPRALALSVDPLVDVVAWKRQTGRASRRAGRPARRPP